MNNQKGIAIPIVLFLMVLFILLAAGITTMITSEPRFSAANENQIFARYAAEAAAKVAILEVQRKINLAEIPNTATVLFNNTKIFDGSPATVSCSYSPNNPSNPTRIDIRAVGTHRGYSVNANVNFYLENSPIKVTPEGVVDLITTGNFSHTTHNPTSSNTKLARWKITEDKSGKVANPPNNLKDELVGGTLTNMQVMFDDKAENDGITISYRATCNILNAKNVREYGGGYGIYYGMIGNADQMNSYIVQWDPGATTSKTDGFYCENGCLLVKKVLYDSKIMPDDNWSKFNSTSKIKQSPGFYEWNTWGKNSGGDPQYYATPFQEASGDEVLRVPLTDLKDGTKGLVSIMQEYDPNFDLADSHLITIDVVKENGKLFHKVYIDKDKHPNMKPVLNFTDHSGKYELKSLKNTHTGLRVWSKDIRVDFQNDPEYTVGQTVSKRVIWVK